MTETEARSPHPLLQLGQYRVRALFMREDRDRLTFRAELKRLVAELKTSRPALFTPASPPPAQDQVNRREPNPWAKESWNFTRQMVLENTNPGEAERLRQEAGANQ